MMSRVKKNCKVLVFKCLAIHQNRKHALLHFLWAQYSEPLEWPAVFDVEVVSRFELFVPLLLRRFFLGGDLTCGSSSSVDVCWTGVGCIDGVSEAEAALAVTALALPDFVFCTMWMGGGSTAPKLREPCLLIIWTSRLKWSLNLILQGTHLKIRSALPFSSCLVRSYSKV